MADVQSTSEFAVQELIERLLPEAHRAIDAIVKDEVFGVNGPNESPIEALFAGAWELNWRLFGDSTHFFCQLEPQCEVSIGDQVVRLDFRVHFGEFRSPYPGFDSAWCDKVAVELDGHEFHERTKEQVAKRNWRDRLLQADGWKVFHFAGSEVWRRPLRCADEVMNYCQDEVSRQYIARREAYRASRATTEQ
jgi:hypothetical protein